MNRPVLIAIAAASVIAGAAAISGCSKPAAANIELRKQNQQLRARVAELENLTKATSRPVPTTAGPVDLTQLYLASGLSFGRLTAVEGNTVKVYVTPLDQYGESLKAAGGFQIEAFDLSRGPNALVGQWTFTPEQAKAAWIGRALLYEYVLTCPLPEGAKVEQPLEIRVQFKDLLTKQTIEGKTTAKIKGS